MRACCLMLFTLGCAYPQEHFVADYSETFCGWDADCGGVYYSSASGCMEVVERDGSERVADCEYSSSAARTCLSELSDLPCSAAWPQSCLDAFECSSN